ncbi:hypothetical protein FIBSPDRAFT_1040846 [Athelia psychrophila]|uniref:Serine hydrolase domain-containing protein n=1 Tax=Athelia psychrophila TaxID=1759441 RepID=A0A166PP67_9AGAM|nr:hypothetical protein FIBSPDRAFT_1040846 [Fibularhizoctonia sp. CBS 109695]
MASTIQECDHDLEFYYLDAPMTLTPNDHRDDSNTFIAPDVPLAFPSCAQPTKTPSYSATARGWFKIDDQMIRADMVGLESSLVLLMNVLNQHKFEAIFGFSQGASVAERIASMLERPHLHPSFFEICQVTPAPLKFIVAIAGFLVRGPCSSWETSPSVESLRDPTMFIETPMLHIIGRTDIVVIRERSEVFINYSKNSRVEEHVGGHIIPTKKRWRKFFAAFFCDPFGEIESPSILNLKGLHVGLTLPGVSMRLCQTLTQHAPEVAAGEGTSTGSSTPDSSNVSLLQTPTYEYEDNDILPWAQKDDCVLFSYKLPSYLQDDYYINYLEA